MLHQYGEAAQTVVDETQGCYSVLDFTRSLDNYDYPLYFDYHHLVLCFLKRIVKIIDIMHNNADQIYAPITNIKDDTFDTVKT